MKKEGLIQVYTGEGKGKTSAAVGLCIRAIACKMKIIYIYFHKEPKRWPYGEHKILKKLGVKIFGFAEQHPYFHKSIDKDNLREDCLKALEFIKKVYKEDKYGLLVLDEVLISLRDGFLKEEEVLEILKLKPKKLELVLTGRGVTKGIIEKADLVSEIKKVKHPFDTGVNSRRGIEY